MTNATWKMTASAALRARRSSGLVTWRTGAPRTWVSATTSTTTAGMTAVTAAQGRQRGDGSDPDGVSSSRKAVQSTAIRIATGR